ncbi:MAG: hypothetical protein PVJ86_10110 [Phycisphaerales bacterium]
MFSYPAACSIRYGWLVIPAMVVVTAVPEPSDPSWASLSTPPTVEENSQMPTALASVSVIVAVTVSSPATVS